MDEQQKERQEPLTYAEIVKALGWTEPLSLEERWRIGDSMPESMNGYKSYPNGGSEGMTNGEYLKHCEEQNGLVSVVADDRTQPELLTEDDGGMAEVVTPGRVGGVGDEKED